MKTVFEHIEQVKGKPHHIRKRIAFTAAASGAVIVALVWLVGSLSLGVFALQQNSFADATQKSPVITTTPGAHTGLAGAAAALESAGAPAHIEIVDTTPSNSAAVKAEQTTIPF